ncbi:HupE/UreJ family protein [Ruegeria sp. Ofav3-42]|uniref:HupE/UreJ family protein n=1 Tax=Ruegeria sp. Ofav3-42 TaxID=2917759 RepID=UPI001EF53E95|nr:HupE/UreJ family protein [Ruegeria sp. Ofav3-42]MCG7522435.1 HupE/UreJ family protein [Ruegeria sp. Ofav3-42]
MQITERSPDVYRLFWRKPDVRQKPMAISVLLPEHCETASPPQPWYDGSAWISDWTTQCSHELAGDLISIPGLQDTQTDVLIRLDLMDLPEVSARLIPDQTVFEVPTDVSSFSVLLTYIGLGTDHILEGFDHLLFVFALLVLIRDRWRLLGAITAFTLAHSITLALASLGLVHVPSPPVEAVIALSIVFLAVEIAKRNSSGSRLSERWPWIVSFSFGLLHGLGFAGALSEIGLPEGDIFVALLGFNIGVEIGQILFVAVVLLLGAALSRMIPVFAHLRLENGQIWNTATSYVVGGIASFWLVERVAGFWA